LKVQHSRDGLYRYRPKRMIGGVLAGVSDKWGLNLAGMRIILVILILFIDFHKAFTFLLLGEIELVLIYVFLGMGWATGLSILTYLILWVVLPLRGGAKSAPDWEQAK